MVVIVMLIVLIFSLCLMIGIYLCETFTQEAKRWINCKLDEKGNKKSKKKKG